MNPTNHSQPSLSICHLLPSLPPHGAEQLLLDIVRNSDHHNVEISICVISSRGELADDFEKLGIPVTLIPKHGRFDISIIWRLSTFLKKNRFDILHTHLFTGDLWGRIASLFLNIGVVSTSHTTSDPNIGRLGQWLDWVLSYRNDVIICVSKAVWKYRKEEVGVPPGKLVNIENGIDLDRFESSVQKEEICKKLDFGNSGIWIAIVGRLVPLKGHMYLIDALHCLSKSFPSLGILIVGEGKCEPSLRLQVEQNGLVDRVKFLGLRRDVPDILKCADILAIPSSREGLPIVLLEAMAAGLPVVATRVGGMPEVIRDGETGFLVDQDAHSIAEALRKMLENPDYRQKMGHASRKLVEERFDIRNVAKKYEDLYRSILLKSQLQK